MGHTDAVGSLDSNIKLSEDRADAVVNDLITNHGISAERLKSYEVASLALVSSNGSEEGRAKSEEWKWLNKIRCNSCFRCFRQERLSQIYTR